MPCRPADMNGPAYGHGVRARSAGESGYLITWLAIAMVIIIGTASITAYISNNLFVSRHRTETVNAMNYAEGGAAAATYDLNQAYTGCDGTTTNLVARLCSNSPTAYITNTILTSATQFVCQRTITNLFASNPVVQLWITNTAYASKFQVVSTAKVGLSSQTVQEYGAMEVAEAAILSTAQGTSDTSTGKGTAQNGNVCLNGDNTYNPQAQNYGPTVIDGAVLANGSVNANSAEVTETSQRLYGTPGQLPSYTSPGSPNQLFDFNRFIAVADNSPGTNHYSNITAFMTDAKTNTLEGVVVIDIATNDKQVNGFTSKNFPNGINIRGTLVFHFLSGWNSSSKIVNTANLNINAANLSALNLLDSSTYATGYPPTYKNSAKKPCNVNIISKGYLNFSCSDDLPALMYDNAILDIHGGCNISGVVYSPAFIEIENHGTQQYIKGTIICGSGCFIDNNGEPTGNVVSYDQGCVNNLATSGAKGKSAALGYWSR